MRGGPATVMGNRYLKQTNKRKVPEWDAKNLHGRSVSEKVPTGTVFEHDCSNEREMVNKIMNF